MNRRRRRFYYGILARVYVSYSSAYGLIVLIIFVSQVFTCVHVVSSPELNLTRVNETSRHRIGFVSLMAFRREIL